MNQHAQPHQRIDGQVAVVTGGSRGIGLAAAQELGRLGAALVLVGRDGSRSEEAARALRSEGIDAVGHGCDVSRASEVQGLVQELGPRADADILVVSAGVMSERMAKTLRTSPSEWDRVMGVNLDGAFHAISAFVPGMAERRRGRVITVSACLGRFSGPGTSGGLAPYRVSKAALNALTKNLAAELQLGARGVLVDAMCPNHCRTDMGGPDAPRSAQEGADTIVWLATRPDRDSAGSVVPTGLLWEDREVVPW
jgi:NAD(P)-dependent dehydrogenase (short-subunit alcohol dehydrogenase family)